MEVERDRENPTSHTSLISRDASSPCCTRQVSCSPRHVLLTSKPVLFILLWTIIVGSIYSSTIYAIPLAVRLLSELHLDNSVYLTVVALNLILAGTMMLYPLGGLLGDVRLGRYRTVVIGLILLMACMAIASIASILVIEFSPEEMFGDKRIKAPFVTISLLSLVLLVAGFSAFESNVVQLGLDQLMEEPSGSLGVFVHWFVWSGRFGQVIIHVLYAARQCTRANPHTSKIPYFAVYSLPAILFLWLVFFLLLNCCTRRQFNTEPVKYNPYKMIVKVLNFARKNKYPVGPTSAFAYCDDTRPSRIDYAKERYGGPFTTSDVEDVKTFIRVLLVLLAFGAVFVLDVPASLFPMFALHTGQETSFNNETCGWKWMLLESGTLSSLTVVVILPIYIWVLYSVLRNRVPKILIRLGFAIGLYIVAVISMLLVDLTGHIVLNIEQTPNAMCMFVEPYLPMSRSHFDTLNLHWAVLIFPNLLVSLAPDLIMATAFEFISAQSPHTMKGVLVGVLFAIRGFFLIIGVLLLLPFALDQIWKKGHLIDDPPVTSCGFGYYLVTTVVALIGLCLFIVAAKKYKYRKREEEPFSQARVEEIFIRRIQHEQSRLNNGRMNRQSTNHREDVPDNADYEYSEEDRLVHLRRPIQYQSFD